MLIYPYVNELDEVDVAILEAVQENGRVSNVELAQTINLSPPATHARVKRLTEQGFIRQYTALLDKGKLGYDMTCFIHVTLQLHQMEGLDTFRARVNQMPEVLECHHVTGEHDYLLKVVVRNRADLERFVVKELTPITGVARIYTSLVLTEIKSTTILPIRRAESGD
jgi:Lrp/AsnC family transcriptional regulator, leucine-responsive regulatory protein